VNTQKCISERPRHSPSLKWNVTALLIAVLLSLHFARADVGIEEQIKSDLRRQDADTASFLQR
jgi:hypothetical protein